MNRPPLVLVSVGTDFHKFDRLIGWIDRWVDKTGPGRVRCLVQYGKSAAPVHAEGRDFLDHAELQTAMAEAVAIVSHGGPATITEARRTGHLPLVVPRDPTLGEHVDGHQQRFVRRLAEEGLVVAPQTEDELHRHLDAALAAPDDYRLPTAHEMAAKGAPLPDAVLRTGQLIDALVSRSRRRRSGRNKQSQRSRQNGQSAAPVARQGQDTGDPARWPAVTVVIPTVDRAELLRTTIDAVLGQDYPGEVHCLVVYDRGEPDGSLVVDRPGRRVSVMTNTRTPGAAGARNSGSLAADGELIAFCDDDDLWLPGKLRAQVRLLLAHPGTELVCSGIQVAYEDHSVDRTAAPEVILNDLLVARLTELHTSTYVLRRSALIDGVGVFDEEVPGSFGEDYDFLLRTARRGPIRNVPEVQVKVLWHRKSYFMGQWETMSRALTWLLRRYPEFRLEPHGFARITGQIAFAEAAQGHRGAALRWAGRAARSRLGEARAYLAVTVACGLPARTVLHVLHRRGRSI